MENSTITTHPQLQEFLTSVIKPQAESVSKRRVCNEEDFMDQRQWDEQNTFDRMSEYLYLIH